VRRALRSTACRSERCRYRLGGALVIACPAGVHWGASDTPRLLGCSVSRKGDNLSQRDRPSLYLKTPAVKTRIQGSSKPDYLPPFGKGRITLAEIVGDCPRCGASKTTFDIKADVYTALEYSWQTHHELFAVCRHCDRPTIFKAHLTITQMSSTLRQDDVIAGAKGSASSFINLDRPVTLRDNQSAAPPEMVPDTVASVFREGAASYSGGCYNAAGAMFRLCLDMVTKALLPEDDTPPQPNQRQRKVLFDRLAWLFEVGRLPKDLQGIADCVRDDGNDGAHDGSLTKEDSEDLLDFTVALLERVYTEPGRLAEAARRRDLRRGR
jgi:hypothetical protein